MSVDIAAWLQGLGLERYEPAFRANEIDAGVLPNLTADDQKDLGVILVGHRRRLASTIEGLEHLAGIPIRIRLDRDPLLCPSLITATQVSIHPAMNSFGRPAIYCKMTRNSTRPASWDISLLRFHRFI
jgi:hypothetical protein